MRIDVLTLFPDIFSGYLAQSVLKLAIQRGVIDVRLHDLRDWATGRHKQVDDRPYGGGPGMVLMPGPVVAAVEEVQARGGKDAALPPAGGPGHLVMLTPQGRRLDQAAVESLARQPRLLLVCGRYEGFDERIRQILKPDEISIGDYVLSGGEVAAMVVIDAVARLVPGVLGDERSSTDDSFSGAERLLEFSQYTRPREFRGLEVPAVLLSGDHAAIARFRHEERLARTRQRQSESSASGSAPGGASAGAPRDEISRPSPHGPAAPLSQSAEAHRFGQRIS